VHAPMEAQPQANRRAPSLPAANITSQFPLPISGFPHKRSTLQL
jgi:hypothetical protein